MKSGKLLEKGSVKKIFLRTLIWMLKPLLRRLTGQEGFRQMEEAGFHLMPVHFYSPIPDTGKLDPSLFECATEITGINFNEQKQLDLLDALQCNYRQEYSIFPVNRTDGELRYYSDNGSYPAQDAAVLHCMVRHFKPKHIIEIGSGYSSMVISAALAMNKEFDPNYGCVWTAIEPYPDDILHGGIDGMKGLTCLLKKPVQSMPLDFFDQLEENDILFIDSSHVLKIGSDVHYEYLHIIPRLKPGVLIHIHDILIPMEYPKEWLTQKHWFWNEQYLLQAFLTFNNKFEIIYSGRYLWHKYAEKLQKFSPYSSVCPGGSFWMKSL